MRWPGGASTTYYNTNDGCFDLGSPGDEAVNADPPTFWRCGGMGPSYFSDAAALAASTGATGTSALCGGSAREFVAVPLLFAADARPRNKSSSST